MVIVGADGHDDFVPHPQLVDGPQPQVVEPAEMTWPVVSIREVYGPGRPGGRPCNERPGSASSVRTA